MARVVVVVSGGVVQSVLYDDQALDVVVVDYDAEGVPEDRLTQVDNYKAFVLPKDSRWFNPNMVDEIFKQIDV